MLCACLRIGLSLQETLAIPVGLVNDILAVASGAAGEPVGGQSMIPDVE